MKTTPSDLREPKPEPAPSPELHSTLDLRHSVRRQVNKALVQVVLARLVVLLFTGLSALLQSLANVANEAGNTFFTFECEFVRRYESLTGVRLGAAIGRPGRYTDLHDWNDDRFPVTDEPDDDDEEDQ